MIGILDTELCNLKSLSNMYKRLGYETVISNKLEVLFKATHLIIPGVGAYDFGVESLKRLRLFEKQVNQEIKLKPILGICLGMQVLGDSSAEGQQKGLGFFNVDFHKFNSSLIHKRVPHMGWNKVRVDKSHPIFKGLEKENRFYFVHSYYAPAVCDGSIGVTKYGQDFTSVYAKNNIIGVQFHPEKSHKYGMTLLKNFAEWDGVYDN